MSYQLREDLHYCYAGRQIVFMDLRNDAYFLLAGPLERAFLAYVAGQRVTNEELNHLLGRGLLIEADGTSPRTAGKSDRKRGWKGKSGAASGDMGGCG